ncbi:MAG: hypothetical protein KAI17_16995, partial [Thiotrichaceae bacterium]|nr:hypothetical protein [Thiotrichaceae bacterium]
NESETDFKPIEVEINGQAISINSKDEMMAFINKGASSMGNKPQRKSENDQIIEQGQLSKADLSLLIDAKNGNKSALAKLAKDSNIDVFDLEDGAAESYQQEFQAQLMTEVDEVAEGIMGDVTLHEEFKRVVNNVPAGFSAELAGNADALRNFSQHVKSGLAQKVIPEAMKQQMLNGGSFMDNYAKIGREMSNAQKAPEASKTTRKENPRAEKLRKRAANHKGSNKGTKTQVSGDDVWNMSSDDFKKQYG